MRIAGKWREIRSGGSVGAALAALLGLAFLIYAMGEGLTNLSFDLPFAFRPSITPTNALIIYMDEDSHKALEQPYFAAWDRRVHAQLLERLKAASVRVVAFDVLFDHSTTNDSVLIDAVKAHGRVVVAARFTPTALAGGSHLWTAKEPFNELRQVAAWGVVEAPDADKVVRQHYAVTRHSTNLVSLAWKTAELSGVEQLPSPFGLRYLNYYGPPQTIPWRSYADVLSNAVPVEVLSNKVVFVGARVGTGYTGAAETDSFPTPYTRRSGVKAAGVEINTTAYLNLAQGDWLTRLSPVNELLLFVGTAVLFGFGLTLFRPVAVSFIAAASMIAVFGIAYFLMWSERIWFPWAIISGVQIPCAAIWAILYRTQRVYREKRSLEEQLARPLPQAAETVASASAPAFAPESPSNLIRQNLRGRLDTTLTDARGGAVPKQERAGPPMIPDCTLLRCIGAGSYGEVWLGSNVIGAFRAIKIVHRANFREDRPYEREFEGIRYFDPVSRNHPGLVHVLHVGRNDSAGYFYYVMELADDASGTQPFAPEAYRPKSLSSELEAQRRLKAEDCLSLGLALADALEYLHQHDLIHRDIKPSNIIFVGSKPKLADIGLITHIGEGRTFVGTEGFFPPEGPGSPSADVFSLGKVLYVALTGLRADQFPDLPPEMPEEQNSQLWKQLNQVVLRACERSTQKRYSTAREVHEDLTRASEHADPGGSPFQKQGLGPRPL